MPTRLTTPAITAAEAKQLAAEHNARPPQIQPWLDFIHYQIREAAGAGKTSIRDPFGGLRCRCPSPTEVSAIVVALRDEGYAVKLSIEAGVLEARSCLMISWG